nr:DUF4329 domain-containing protein [Chryseobacterium sp. WG23]
MEPHVLFNTRENAAANFGQQYNGRSILEKREYATIIYVKVTDGKKYYAYNTPSRGSEHGLTDEQFNKYIPKGAVATAFEHTHSNDDYGPGNNYDDQNFSDRDKSYAGELNLDAFLVTPEGSLRCRTNPVGCCAEFNAGNNLLLNNPSAIPSQINFTDAIRPRTGKVVPMCDNCKTTFGK